MLRVTLFLAALCVGGGAAHAGIGMAGSAKRLCADSGFLPPSRDFYECAHTAIIVRTPHIHYELTGRFARGSNAASSDEESNTIPRLRGSVGKGMAAYNSGDYETALARWLPKAQSGNADAQNNMGVLWEDGLTNETPKDDEKAAEWYLLAARQGHVLAMENLARVQTRLGHPDSAQTWINSAASVRQQQAANQQQGMALIGYALGCAIGGGCQSSSPAYGSMQPVAAPPRSVLSKPITPAPPIKPAPTCKLNPYFTDMNGLPKVECH